MSTGHVMYRFGRFLNFPYQTPRVLIGVRAFSKSNSGRRDWRKEKLLNIEQKFQSSGCNSSTVVWSGEAPPITEITEEEDLQSMWKAMESRVTKRRSRPLAESRGKVGRTNIRRTEEDLWLEEGLYDCEEDKK